MNKTFTSEAWQDYLWWLEHDKKTLRRINSLIKDIERSPFDGLGKPEALRFGLSGFYSRRIDSVNRLVYNIEGDSINIYSVKDHYR
jgi:toxin YoeB